jgi:beta-lactamase class D
VHKSLLIFLLTVIADISFGQSNYQKFFDSLSVKGSTTIFDFKNQKWIYTDSLDAERKTLPASTFKILNSLIILETKAVDNEHETLTWDGKDKTFFGTKIDSWNKDTDLKNAYKNSTVWFYEALAKRIGREKYKTYLAQCQYGNQNLTETGIDFWNYGEFGISPKNQIEFLIRLFQNNLPFSTQTIDKVKELMISEQNEQFTCRDKTGWTKKDGTDIGWWVGYVQTSDNIFFFSTRLTKSIDDNNLNFSKARKEITKAILKELKAI